MRIMLMCKDVLGVKKWFCLCRVPCNKWTPDMQRIMFSAKCIWTERQRTCKGGWRKKKRKKKHPVTKCEKIVEKLDLFKEKKSVALVYFYRKWSLEYWSWLWVIIPNRHSIFLAVSEKILLVFKILQFHRHLWRILLSIDFSSNLIRALCCSPEVTMIQGPLYKHHKKSPQIQQDKLSVKWTLYIYLINMTLPKVVECQVAFPRGKWSRNT